MQLFPSREVLISFGSIEIRWYAFLIIVGALIAYYFSGQDLKKAGYQNDVVDDLFVGALTCGVIGARIWYVLFSDLSYYLQDPIRIIQIWNGGLAIQGGVVGGVIFCYFYAKKHNYSTLHIVDLVLPNVLWGQAIGRWGNFVNGECYGPVVNENFFNGILGFIKEGMYIDGAYRMPMFFFESVLCIAGWFLIRFLKKHYKKQRGNGAYSYLAWYGSIRILIEHFRTDSLMIGNLKMAQVTGFVMALIGLLGLLGAFNKLRKKKKPAVIFDLDGTVLDTADTIINSFVEVFKKHKPELVLTEEDKVSFLGPTLWESFKKYAPELDTDMLVEEYRVVNRRMHDEGMIKPINNVPELLEYLKNEGYKMGIASSKQTETCLRGLSICKLEDYFDTIVGVDKVEKPKPDKETLVKAYQALGHSMDNCIYVGDSGSDIECARNAGVYAIAYVSDELKRQELIDSKPNQIIEDMIELKEVLKEEHEWTYNMM